MVQVLAPNAPEPRNEPDPAFDLDQELPYLADGVELIGKYEDSGFRSAPYLVKRGDGQVIQVSELIYLVAAGIDVSGDLDEVAERVSARYGREVSPENVVYLIHKKLRPTGLLWSEETADQPTARANPLLALRLRLPLVPEHIHRVVTSSLKPLFWPPLVAVAVVLLLALDVWLIADLGTGVVNAAQALIYAPQLLLPMTALTILMGAFHETGHATAARYGGAKPGAMGAGIYLVWPVFYTDVTDSYRLDRRGRLRTDLGGIYFNVLFMVFIGSLYLATGHVLFLVFVLLAHVETLRQFLPFIRLDGYYIVSDLAGVPNLFAYMRPALARATRLWRKDGGHTQRTRPLEALTRKAQIVLIVWACVTGPILAINIAMLLFFFPQIAGAAWGSAGIQIGVLVEAVGSARLASAANAFLGVFFLVLPAAGMIYITFRMLSRVPASVRRSWVERPGITGALTGAIVLAVVLQVGLVWPSKFTAAASEPGRIQAEAEAAASAAAARDRLARGAQSVAEVVSRVAPGGTSAPARPVPLPAPTTTEPTYTSDDEDWSDSSDGGSSSADDESTDAPAGQPGAPPAGLDPAPGPATTVPGAERPSPTTPPGDVPAQTTTTAPRLPSIEELLTPLFEPQG